MKAVLRLGLALLVAGAAFGPAPAFAQEAETNQPETVGPRELQDFNLQGNVVRPAEPVPDQPAPPAQSPREATQQPASPAQQAPAAQAGDARPAAAAPARTAASPAQRSAQPAQPLRQTAPASSVTVALPRLGDGLAQSSAAAPAPTPAQFPAAPAGLEPDGGPSLLPWLLAALALGLGAGFLFWRSRGRAALAGGPHFDAFVAPDSAPSPPRPAPKTAPKPAPRAAASTPATQPQPAPPLAGLVSTRLRPWVEIGFHPLRCLFDEEQVAIEFELELFNSGSAPARAVLAEATLFNASPNQEAELEAFFANPVGQGDRIVAIPPLKKVELRTKVVAPRASVQIFEVAGRKLFVPVIAFNAIYRWSGGDGQTSASYLIGRETKGDKLAPFRADMGPRAFGGLGARPLPPALRR